MTENKRWPWPRRLIGFLQDHCVWRSRSCIVGPNDAAGLTVTHDLKDDKALRVIAVDLDGNEHPGGIRGGMGVANFRQMKLDYPIPSERVRE